MAKRKARKDLQSRAAAALDYLWAYAEDAATPQAERVKLWQWFAAMGIGTPRQMAAASDAPKGGGVVILPDVMEAPNGAAGGELTV